MCDAIKDGLSDRKGERDKEESEEKPLTLKKGRRAVTKIIVEDDFEESETEEKEIKEVILDEKITDLLIDEGLIDEDIIDLK
jgi:hypothetical protein